MKEQVEKKIVKENMLLAGRDLTTIHLRTTQKERHTKRTPFAYEIVSNIELISRGCVTCGIIHI